MGPRTLACYMYLLTTYFLFKAPPTPDSDTYRHPRSLHDALPIFWKSGPEERDRLLARFPPRYERRVADHVTLRFGTDADTPLPAETEARIVGEADDDAGVQALVVEIGGTIARGDGSH